MRLRQVRLPKKVGGVWEVEQRFALMRDCLERLQGQRLGTQHLTEELLRQNRDEYRQFGRGRRALRGYQSTHTEDARLYDGTR